MVFANSFSWWSQMRRKSWGIADAPNKLVHAGSTGRRWILDGQHILWEELSSKALMYWEIVRRSVRNYSWAWRMAKTTMNVGYFCVKQAGSVLPLDACCVSLCTLKKAEMSLCHVHVLSWLIFLSEYFLRWQMCKRLASSRKLIIQQCWLSSSCPPVVM